MVVSASWTIKQNWSEKNAQLVSPDGDIDAKLGLKFKHCFKPPMEIQQDETEESMACTSSPGSSSMCSSAESGLARGTSAQPAPPPIACPDAEDGLDVTFLTPTPKKKKTVRAE